MSGDKKEESKEISEGALKLFDAFYTRFLLRDIVGKVVPGAIFIALCLIPELGLGWIVKNIREITTPEIVVFVALSWVVALSMQGINSRWNNFYFPGNSARNNFQTRETEFIKSTMKINEFLRSASSDEKAQYERFVVIKEATGNTFYCTGWGFLFVLIFNFFSWAVNPTSFRENSALWQYISHNIIATIVYIVFFLIILWSMYLMNKDHIHRQLAYVEGTLEQIRSRERKSPWY